MISNASVPIGATYTPSGGSATDLVSLGQTGESNKLYVDDGADLILRKTILATSRPPVPAAGAPNGYTQQRTNFVLHSPMLLDNGAYTKNSLQVGMAFDPEADASERAYLRGWLAYLGTEAGFDSLFDAGSVA